jgi:hypothetical protein
MSTNLPDLSKLNQNLAQDNARVGNFVDNLMERIDSLLEATESENWDEVERQSNYLSSSGLAYGFAEIAKSAQRVCEALEDRNNPTEIRRSMIRLVGRCGAARKPGNDTAS